MKATYLVWAIVLLANTATLAQSNPIPFANQPLVPTSTTPGGPGFVLAVNGSEFVSNSVVNWNGKALQTTFVNGSQLKATVPASLITNAGTASVTVVNSAPGGGTSNVLYFSISSPVSTLVFANFTNTGVGTFLPTTADFNGDGKLDLVGVDIENARVSVQLGKGDGSFQAPVSYPVGATFSGVSLAVGDFNGDGRLDIAVTNDVDATVSILLGNGDGTFQPQTTHATANGPEFLVVGDFNGDGKLDIATANNGVPNGMNNVMTLSVLLGNGDGSFQTHVDYAVPHYIYALTLGDFNGDGKLDLAYVGEGDIAFVPQLSILLGNGDGSFQVPTQTVVPSQPSGLITADVNGDGKLDLIMTAVSSANSVYVLLGNGDGSFQPGVGYVAGKNPAFVAAADLNADGKIDLAVPSNSGVSILLGNGDGTFEPAIVPFSSYLGSLAVGDFNGDGRMDLAATSAPLGINGDLVMLLQGAVPAIQVSPTSLTFGQQSLDTTSAPQTVTLTNTGTAPLTISNIGIGGANGSDFAETNACGPTLVANASCQVNVTFTPTADGIRSATLSISYNGPGSPQTVSLTGTTPAFLSPATVTFPNQYVGTSGLPQTVMLTNLSASALNITAVTASPSDFAALSACGSSLAAAQSCSIGVFFDPTTSGTRSGVLTVTDSASGSPQTASLVGTGQDFSLTPSSSSSATVTAGQTANYSLAVTPGGGFNQMVVLACSGAPTQSTCSISPSPVTLGGSAPTSVTVTVTTTAGTSTSLGYPYGILSARTGFAMFLLFPGLPGMVLIFHIGTRSHKRRSRLFFGLFLVCLFSLALTLSACGSGSKSGNGGGGTPSGTFNLTVTGSFTSGSTNLTHNAKLTLIVH